MNKPGKYFMYLWSLWKPVIRLGERFCSIFCLNLIHRWDNLGLKIRLNEMYIRMRIFKLLINFLFRVVWKKEMVFVIVYKLCFRIWCLECPSKLRRFEIEWDTSAYCPCWRRYFFRRKHSYCKDTHRSFLVTVNDTDVVNTRKVLYMFMSVEQNSG